MVMSNTVMKNSRVARNIRAVRKARDTWAESTNGNRRRNGSIFVINLLDGSIMFTSLGSFMIRAARDFIVAGKLSALAVKP
jgi:hypothetical protein